MTRFRIWARVMRGDKILTDCLFDGQEVFDPENFDECVRQICHTLDIATPIILRSNVANFCNFNITKFAPEAFVEEVNFDFLILENVPLPD